ncbi:MAG: hypothetical protein H6700_01165 [Myxococcales bacterium]|nr:hypothetical protein [Myxococcales bacterium]
MASVRFRVAALSALVALGSACNDGKSGSEEEDASVDAVDDGASDSGESDATGDDAATDTRTDTTVDPDATTDDTTDSGPTDGGDPDTLPPEDTSPDGDDADVTPPAACGDGVVDADEECDDGDANSDALADACRTNCTLARCGDGVVDDGEGCDDGNLADGDSCSATCESIFDALCSPCAGDADCGGGVCLALAGGDFCGSTCVDGTCPGGFSCETVRDEAGDTTSQCVPLSGECVGCLDRDRDGFGVGPDCDGYDCDDSDRDVNVGATEVCDGADNDCDGQIDELGALRSSTFYADADGDGAGDAAASVEACGPTDDFPANNGDDCNDGNAEVFPGADEICDGVDNDCNPDTADGASNPEVGVACDGPDADSCASARTICVAGEVVCPETAESVAELCDGLDNDCDPDTADGADDPLLGEPCDGADDDLCEEGIYVCAGAEGRVCTDRTRSNREVCDGVDNDCNGAIDDVTEGAPTWYFDRDGDRYGADDSATVACSSPGRDFVERGGDCDDTQAEINPDADEVCDGADNDCDGEIDVDAIDGVTAFPDADDDGFGGDAGAEVLCSIPAGYLATGGDCADDNPAVSPDATEDCADGLDNDCNGRPDCSDAACAGLDICAPPDCVDSDLGVAVGARVASGSTAGAPSDEVGSCVTTDGPERAFLWTAPYEGEFTFDTLGSSYDTVLFIRDAACDGDEIDCNDDGFTGANRTRSQLVIDAYAGQRLVVFVDSFDARGGNYVLNIAGSRVEICDNGADDDADGDVDCDDSDCDDLLACRLASCPDADLGSAIGTPVVEGTTEGAAAVYTAGCGTGGGGGGGAAAPDVFLTWTAPSSGTFVIDTDGSDFDTILAVLDGACDGDEVECNDDVSGGTQTSSVSLDATGGQTYTFIVSGFGSDSGAFALNISGVETECANAIDDDGDLATDCGDTDCDFAEPCCPADVFEPNEGNGGAPSTTYETYLTNADASLTVRSDNIDSFRLPACNGARYLVTALFSNADGNIDLRLLRQNGSTIAVANTNTDDETLEFELGENLDRVFLQAFVTGAPACVAYTLQIEVDTSACP